MFSGLRGGWKGEEAGPLIKVFLVFIKGVHELIFLLVNFLKKSLNIFIITKYFYL